MTTSKRIKISGPPAGAGLYVAPVDPHTPQPPDHAKRSQFLLGAERLTARLQQERGEEHAQPHHKALEALKGLHNELCALEELLAVKLPDHVGPAASKAGQALFKLLGRDCFASEAEAVSWGRKYLPLTEAWREAGRDADERVRTARDHQLARRDFWTDAERLAGAIARHATRGGCIDLGKAIDECLTAGKWK